MTTQNKPQGDALREAAEKSYTDEEWGLAEEAFEIRLKNLNGAPESTAREVFRSGFIWALQLAKTTQTRQVQHPLRQEALK